MSDFDHVFRKYHNPLVLYARKFVANEPAILDLVQDVFALVWERKKLHLDDDHLKAYLFASVRNACLNYLKHEKVVHDHQNHQLFELSRLEVMHYQSGEKSLIEKESMDRIFQEINSLSPVHREVIELSRLEGLRNKEIADRLNIPVRTVETRLFRALGELRQKLSEKLIYILLNFCDIKEN